MTLAPEGLRLRRRRLLKLLRLLLTLQLSFSVGLFGVLVQLGREPFSAPALALGALVALLLLPRGLFRWIRAVSWLYLPLLLGLDILHIALLLWSQPPSDLAHGSLWALVSLPLLLLAGRWWTYSGALPILFSVLLANGLVVFVKLPSSDALPIFVLQALIAILVASLSTLYETQVRRELSLRDALYLSEERVSLANQLHEAMASQVAELQTLLEQAEADQLPSAAGSSLRQASELTQELYQQLQRSLRGVRPTPLGARTLPEALARETEHCGRELGIECQFRYAGHLPPLRPAVAEYLYRTTQEALDNVRGHAAASQVLVELGHEHDLVVLRVSDDGVGFDAARLLERQTEPWGLLSMRSRAEALGGQLRIESALGAGTQVEVRLPLPGW